MGRHSPPGLQLAGTREMLLPFTIACCFVLYYLVKAPFAVVVGVASPMLVLYAFAPSWGSRSVTSFDRAAVALLATGQPKALVGRYQRAWGMRLFAPPAIVAERRAMVAAENGHYGEARRAYGHALHEHGQDAPLRVMLGYAHACFQVGDDEEAIRVYRQLLDVAGTLPGVQRNLAHAMVRAGESIREALGMLEKAEQSADGRRDELLLLRALAHAKLGERERAQALSREIAADDDVLRHLHEELRVVLDAAAAPR